MSLLPPHCCLHECIKLVFHINHKRRALANNVIQGASRRVKLLRHPVDAAAIPRFSLTIGFIKQLFSNVLSSCRLIDKEIFNVAIVSVAQVEAW